MDAGPVDDLLAALGRLIVERFRETAQEQTDELLTGNEGILQRFVGPLAATLLRLVFLLVGVAARAMLTAFGPQAEFLHGVMAGAPWELTAGLPEVRDTARLAQSIAFLALPAVIAWGGLGYQFSFTDGGAPEFGKRVVLGGVLMGSILPLLDLSLRAVHALGVALVGSGDVVPGYASVSEAVFESVTVLAGANPAISGPPGSPLSQAALSLASDDTVAAGAVALVYALALLLGGGSAAGRIAILDALYVLAPLAALAGAVPIGQAIFSVWLRAWATCLLVVLPAGLLLKFAAALLERFAVGGPVWVALIGGVAVFFYAALVGRACFGIAWSAPGAAKRIVHVVANPRPPAPGVGTGKGA